MADSSDLTLRYGTIVVGQIRNALCDQRTWFGDFEQLLDPAESPLARRLIAYIAFCREWHERLDADPQGGPDAAEFDQYSDVVYSGLWTTDAHDGTHASVIHAPVFSGEMDVTWRSSTNADIESASLQCPACKGRVTLEQFLDTCSRFWPKLGVVQQHCPLCKGRNEVEIEPGGMWFGYIYAAGSAHFSRERFCELPISGRLPKDDGLHVRIGDRVWIVPNDP